MQGIYCIETAHWTRRGSPQPSVRHLLRLIESIDGTPFIHRHFSTWDELNYLLVQSTKPRQRPFPSFTWLLTARTEESL